MKLIRRNTFETNSSSTHALVIISKDDYKAWQENKKVLNEHKTQCVICGESAKCCLEFHHIGEKLFNISQAVSHIPTDLFIKELSQTVCVCKNCGKIKSTFVPTNADYLEESRGVRINK